MQQLRCKYLARRPPPPPDPRGQKVRIQLFNYMVMLHNKLKGMRHRAPCKHIFSLYTHPQPVSWIKGKKNLNVVMLHIKLREKKYGLTLEANAVTLHTRLRGRRKWIYVL